MKLLDSLKELKQIIIVVLILTIVFAFDDGAPTFIPSDWASNFIFVLILVLVTVIVNIIGYKLMANYYKSEITYELWGISQFLFGRGAYFRKIKKLYLGPILAILITLLSIGRAFFTAVSTFSIVSSKKLGRRFIKEEGKEEARIALSGFIFNLILLIIFKIFGVDRGVLINTWFIVWHLLPFSNLPGAKIFFNSRTLYVLTLFFLIFFLLLFSVINVILAIIIAGLFALIIAILFFYYLQFPK